jgi:NAD(P)-dependent dehydrogenase (short-subunit alcohol dehydrogenase family)
LPLLAPGANVVMVSSGMGTLDHLSAELSARFQDPMLDRAGLDALVETFLTAVRGGSSLGGFPRNAYSVSKVALNAYTRLLAPELESRGIRVNAVCPGWVRTRMGGSGASRSVEQGARGIVWAATLGQGGPSGGFFRDGRTIDW